MLDLTLAIIGAISGLISLLGLIYFFAYWRGQVDKDREYFRECLKLYPPAEMHTMVKTLWDVYILDPLHHRPDLAKQGSSYKLTKHGESLIPDNLKPLLDRIPRNPVLREDIATGYLVVKHLGLANITRMAEEKNLSVQESIALLSTYLEMNANNQKSA